MSCYNDHEQDRSGDSCFHLTPVAWSLVFIQILTHELLLPVPEGGHFPSTFNFFITKIMPASITVLSYFLCHNTTQLQLRNISYNLKCIQSKILNPNDTVTYCKYVACTACGKNMTTSLHIYINIHLETPVISFAMHFQC